MVVELIHNSGIIGPLVNKTWGILLHTQNCGSNELAAQLLESLSPLIGSVVGGARPNQKTKQFTFYINFMIKGQIYLVFIT